MLQNKIPSPCYVLEEDKLRANLQLIKHVKEQSGADIILAFKAFALWRVFPIIKEYINYTTASSLAEAMLATQQMQTKAHTYAPVYNPTEFKQIMDCSSHITFNSIQHYNYYREQITDLNTKVSCGLRINPQLSQVDTDLYNPCAPGSRLGVTADNLQTLPQGIEGLHCHTLCESDSYMLERVLEQIEGKFGKHLANIKWLNLGGGHLITRADYDVEHLISLIKRYREKYPHIQFILEPGSAFAWQTGFLKTTILDIVENSGIKTLILNASFACHMPDCLEMPYTPNIEGGEIVDGTTNAPIYRLGGNSCLSGDFVGDYTFETEPQVGDDIILKDMLHYTTVKTTMFNGVSHPSITLKQLNGNIEILKEFTYTDYKDRMS